MQKTSEWKPRKSPKTSLTQSEDHHSLASYLTCRLKNFQFGECSKEREQLIVNYVVTSEPRGSSLKIMGQKAQMKLPLLSTRWHWRKGILTNLMWTWGCSFKSPCLNEVSRLLLSNHVDECHESHLTRGWMFNPSVKAKITDVDMSFDYQFKSAVKFYTTTSSVCTAVPFFLPILKQGMNLSTRGSILLVNT